MIFEYLSDRGTSLLVELISNSNKYLLCNIYNLLLINLIFWTSSLTRSFTIRTFTIVSRLLLVLRHPVRCDLLSRAFFEFLIRVLFIVFLCKPLWFLSFRFLLWHRNCPGFTRFLYIWIITVFI